MGIVEVTPQMRFLAEETPQMRFLVDQITDLGNGILYCIEFFRWVAFGFNLV